MPGGKKGKRLAEVIPSKDVAREVLMLVRYGKRLNGTLQGGLWTVVFFMALAGQRKPRGSFFALGPGSIIFGRRRASNLE